MINRRKAIAKIFGGVAAATTVSAKDFDPTVQDRDNYGASLASIECKRSDEDKWYKLESQLPPNIKQGLDWLHRCRHSSVASTFDTFPHRPLGLVEILIPSRWYRWVMIRAYLNRLELMKPNLSEKDWELCLKIDQSRQSLLNPINKTAEDALNFFVGVK